MCYTTLQAFVFLQFLLPVSVGQLPPSPEPGELENRPAPRIFVEKRILPLGEVIEGDVVPIQWILENRGDADLLISKTKAGCGCTVVKLSEEEKLVPAGGTLALRAEFDSTRRRGKQEKTVLIFSNDPVEPKLKLEFTAKVERLFETNPSTLINLRVLQRGQVASQTFDVIPSENRKSAKIVSFDMPEGFPISASIEPFSNADAEGQRVRFTPGRDAPMGIIQDKATVRFSIDGIEREREYLIRGEVVGDIIWKPKVVDTTRQETTRGKKILPVTIRSPNKMPFSITGATAEPLFDVEVEQLKSGKPRTSYKVRLTLRNDAPPGPFGTMLNVRTDSLDQPVVKVPVFGIVAHRIKIDPPILIFRGDGSASGTTRRIKLLASTSTTLDIVDVSCDLPSIDASIDEDHERRYRHLRFITVRYTGGLPKGRHETSLVVQTSVGGAEELRIPVIIDAG